jgi:hypothetical protein
MLQDSDLYTDDDSATNEQASAATSDSGQTRRSSKKDNDRRDNDRRDRRDGRDRRDRGRSSSRYNRRRGRDRSRSESLECKYCDKHNVRPRHIGISEDKCYLNPKRKGWRPEFHCRKLGIDYVEKKHFEDKQEKREKK